MNGKITEKGYAVLPGFCDVHVHFREPGFSYKETISTGTAAAARGGFTCVCTMPNLSPAPDSLENLRVQTDIIRRDALIRTVPYGTITKNEEGAALSDMEEMAPFVAAFSDDGRGVQGEDMMLRAMEKAAELGKIITAHAEDMSLVRGGYIHDGEYARIHGHAGNPSESEWRQVERDLALAKKTGCAYHVCHVSSKESVALIRKAKAEGTDVTCETAPHYLLLTDMDLEETGNFRMNPPIRSAEDRDALIEGIKDGTIDMIATDHAPHSAEEKSRGLRDSASGIVGIEIVFPLLYTYLVRKGVISLEKLIELMNDNPRKRFGLLSGDDRSEWDLDAEYRIDPRDFLSRGRSTPFDGWTVYGVCRKTVYNGKTVYEA